MSTKSIDDYEHPDWCDLRRCEPEGYADGGRHTSVGTMLPLGSCSVTMSLYLDDDHHPLTGKLSNHTRIRVSMEDTESVGLFCDGWFEASDARLLGDVLNRYADLCDRARRSPARFPAKTLQAEQRSA